MESQKRSFKGFKFSKNILSAIKKCIYVLVPAVLTELVTHNIVASGLAALVGPMILNGVEYYITKVETD